MKVMTGLLVLAALIAGVFGPLLLSQATMGVGVIGLACLIGMARIAQAAAHKDELHDILRGRNESSD